jgi:murein DD-endopeptidase MepM/ murein hydrolase activator NlpD
VVVDVKQDSNIGGKTKRFDKYGNYIEIAHKNGEYSIYEHIKKLSAIVKVGDEVKTKQLIGYSGATGWIAQLGPHIHFDVHKYFGRGREDYRTLKIRWKK